MRQGVELTLGLPRSAGGNNYTQKVVLCLVIWRDDSSGISQELLVIMCDLRQSFDIGYIGFIVPIYLGHSLRLRHLWAYRLWIIGGNSSVKDVLFLS
jgi:hypothetical protein